MAKGNSQPGLDQYSFDEKGRAFLRQMRYISGHFAAHGVSPFDHRVFSAAAERVQLKDSQKESSIVDFPGQVTASPRGPLFRVATVSTLA
mmetsp:Transcript_11434/g.47577  ORF Transcript_11434/g.47577 Transcript_11434/m.47577 type:complete len:90 (+) Transcript_11434:2424-2693(+)